MRNMSFALTTQQVLDRTKTVTRRLGWAFLKPGDHVQPVKKCQGLKPGESIEKIGGPIQIESVRRETLSDIIGKGQLGYIETHREGFPQMSPIQFVEMFCHHMRPCQQNWKITRIEFSYVAAPE